jgi:hypothetical protein
MSAGTGPGSTMIRSGFSPKEEEIVDREEEIVDRTVNT